MYYRIIRLNVPDGMGGRVYKYYARAISIARATVDMIAAKIAETNTLTPTDVKAVFDGVWREIFSRLRDGQIVELGELGHFRLIVRNNGGSLTEKDWSPDLIKGVYVQFIPTKFMKSITTDVPLHRWHNPEMTAAQRAVSSSAAAHAVAKKTLQESESMLLRFQFRQEQQKRSVTDPETKVLLERLQAEVASDRLRVEKTEAAYTEKQTQMRLLKESLLRMQGIDPNDETITIDFDSDDAELTADDLEGMDVPGARIESSETMTPKTGEDPASVDLSVTSDESPLLTTEELAESLDEAEARLLFEQLRQRLDANNAPDSDSSQGEQPPVKE